MITGCEPNSGRAISIKNVICDKKSTTLVLKAGDDSRTSQSQTVIFTDNAENRVNSFIDGNGRSGFGSDRFVRRTQGNEIAEHDLQAIQARNYSLSDIDRAIETSEGVQRTALTPNEAKTTVRLNTAATRDQASILATDVSLIILPIFV